MQWPFVKRSTYDEVCAAAREHNRRANNAESHAERIKSLALQWKRRAEIAEARNQPLIEQLIRMASLTAARPIVVPAGEIPDPPSVSAADAKVAVALRDREVPPLKRPLRPGEDE